MSRYDLLRKRIAPIAFILGMALIVRQSCQGADRVHATLVLELGAAEAKVHAIDATILVDGEAFGELHRTALSGLKIGHTEMKVALPKHDAELRIDIDTGAAARKHLVRLIHADEGAVVTVPLAAEIE